MAIFEGGVELVRGIHNLREKHKGCVLTIGKFDGVHLGHQAVLKKLLEKARAMQLPACVMVFEPQPEEVFTPQSAPPRLSRMREKYLHFSQLGIDRLICVKFNHEFAHLSAQYFVEELLVAKLGIRFLVVGDDFRFGQGRMGDFAMLQEEGLKCGFDVVNTNSFRVRDCRISSTAIRAALQEGDMQLTQEMLGRPYSITGKVVHGDKRGRTIGFPTANVLLNRLKSAVQGVFAVRVNMAEDIYQGVANIGNRPTVNGDRAQLEVHLFDFVGDLYGQFISVEILQKLRSEQRFASFDELKHQINIDANAAKAFFAAE